MIEFIKKFYMCDIGLKGVSTNLPILYTANSPTFSIDCTKCPWHVQINDWSIYEIVSDTVWKEEGERCQVAHSQMVEKVCYSKSHRVELQLNCCS